MFKQIGKYQIGLFISTLSLGLGLLREFLIVGLLGFTAANDDLQLYLSIFYTIGLTIDTMRLACLNLYNTLALTHILLCATIVGFPIALIIGCATSFATQTLNVTLLTIVIFGGYLNLMAALLITYKQRNNYFIIAQIINILPNFILIPGIIYCFFYNKNNLLPILITLTSIVPLIQCLLLLALPNQDSATNVIENPMTLRAGVMIFLRHLSTIISEQFYQVLLRSAFYNFGAGFLTLFSLTVRIYAAARFILIDSLIGATLAESKATLQKSVEHIALLQRFLKWNILLMLLAFLVSLHSATQLFYFSLQFLFILFIGFYLAMLVRLCYFNINRNSHYPHLIARFSILEFICLILSLLLIQQANYSLLIILWIGYIAKPMIQLTFIRKHYGLLIDYGNQRAPIS